MDLEYDWQLVPLDQQSALDIMSGVVGALHPSSADAPPAVLAPPVVESAASGVTATSAALPNAVVATGGSNIQMAAGASSLRPDAASQYSSF